MLITVEAVALQRLGNEVTFFSYFRISGVLMPVSHEPDRDPLYQIKNPGPA
ncbi:MAG: hypothetical protein Q8S57_10025 [Methanoregula sp.]|nr:hypothetical protein [Methanoregula sp.]